MFYGTCICPMHAVSNPIIQTSTVQSHPASKFIVPIESRLMVCYLTSFKSNIVCVTIFEIFAAKIPDLDLGQFKVVRGQSSWCQSIAHGWFTIRLQLTQSLYLSPFSQYLTCNFDDLEVCQFKVIQDKSTVHRANRKPIGGCLSDMFGVQHCICLHIRDI